MKETKYYRIKAQLLDPCQKSRIFSSKKTIEQIRKDYEDSYHIFSLDELKGFNPKSEIWYELELTIWEQEELIKKATEEDIKEGMVEMWEADKKDYQNILTELENSNWVEAYKLARYMDTSPRGSLPKKMWELFNILKIT